MTKPTFRGLGALGACAGRRLLPCGAPLRALIVVLAVAVGLAGCDKPPTFDELIHGKKKEEPPAPKLVKTPTATPAPVITPFKAPEKPKRKAQEVIAEFNATPPEKRTNEQIVELASVPDAADQYTELNLRSSGVSDGGMAALPKFEHVETLLIDNCSYSNAGLGNIAKMKSLTTLSMNSGSMGNSNCDAGLAALKQLPALTSLSLESTAVTMAGLATLGEMTRLETLNVAHTRFSDDNLKKFSSLVNLKDLNISYTTVGDNGFEFLLPLHELETLKIAHLPITGRGLKECARQGAWPKLRNLVIFSNMNLEIPAYEGIYSFRKTLESLDLGQTTLTDDRFYKAITPLSKLETLLVHDNPGLSDVGMQGLPKLRKLKRLYFWKNLGITDTSLPQIAKLRSLEHLTLDATSCSEGGVRQLKKRLKNCEVVFNYKKIE